METSRDGIRRVATSWALIGVGAAGVLGATGVAYADLMKAPAAETSALPWQITPPLAPTTSSTSINPSYSPKTHTRSSGS